MAQVITNSQKLPLSLVAYDSGDNPARLDGVPQWSLSDAKLGALAVAADGLSAVFIPAGVLGLVQVKVQADADLTPTGIRLLTDQMDIQIEAGEAVRILMRAGAPEPK